LIDRFISEVSAYLSPVGRVLLMQSNLAGVDETLERFALRGMSARVLARRRLPFFETLFLIEAKFAR
jgi:release factor glutamine methyltransferase